MISMLAEVVISCKWRGSIEMVSCVSPISVGELLELIPSCSFHLRMPRIFSYT
jgi:hypothetical protein